MSGDLGEGVCVCHFFLRSTFIFGGVGESLYLVKYKNYLYRGVGT